MSTDPRATAPPAGAADIGCCPSAGGVTLSRRGLLRAGAVAAAVAATSFATGGLSTSMAFADVSVADAGAHAGGDPDVLVVLSLHGGADGLSMIAPVGDPFYGPARPTLAVPARRAIALDSTFGLHPALSMLTPFWTAGTFGAVQAVGQRSASLSHFLASDEMDRAAPDSALRTAWLNRSLAGMAVGLTPAAEALRGLAMGSAATPSVLLGDEPAVVIPGLKSFALAGSGSALARRNTALGKLWAAPGTPANTTLAVLGTVGGLAPAGPEHGAVYPSTPMGQALRDLAQVIKAGVGLRVATVDCGSWDMHQNAGTVDGGAMTKGLTDLGSAMAAFATDLGPARMAKVSLVTLSEFGRRVHENGTGGTDHGHGNAMLFMGGGLVGGKVHGAWPGLGPRQLDLNGNLAGTTDYRDVLAEILTKRVGVKEITRVFPGLQPAPVGLARTG